MSINFVLVPENEIPPPKIKGVWPELFSKIPEGQSAIITHAESDIKRFVNNIRSQLGQQKMQGKYKTFHVTYQGDKVYITNRKPSQ
jgi:hypothetical protein